MGDEGTGIGFIENIMEAIIGFGKGLEPSFMAKKFWMVLERKLSIIPE
jgi:hypothetical protein